MSSPVSGTLAAALADRYRLTRELGRGGMATVFLARDLKHDRDVAIKILSPDLGAALGTDRFLAEIQVTAALQHPHLLPLFDSGAVGHELFYVMPYIAGGTLRQRITPGRGLPIAEVMRLLPPIGQALQHAHDRGVIHRDLKPENILLQDDQPIVADFGIALDTGSATGRDARLTSTGLAVGTPRYMSPEQAVGERQLDARSDVFALGAITYELLTGDPPHDGPSAAAMVAQLLTSAPRPVHERRPEVPAEVSAVVARALAKEPAQRFDTMREFIAALQAAATPRSAPAAAEAPARAHRSRRMVALGGAAVLAAVLGVIWWRSGATSGAASTSLEPNRVLVAHQAAADAASATGEAAVGTLVTDALTERLSQLPWAVVSIASSSVGDEAALAQAARRARASVVAVTSTVASGDRVQLRLRLLDAASGEIIRSLPAVTLDASPTSAAWRDAVEPLAVAAGFATAPTLGRVTVPADHLPSLAAVRELAGALDGIDGVAASFERRIRAIEQLTRVVKADSAFLQAKLWLAWLASNNYVRVRGTGGSALADTIRQFSDEALAKGTQYEAALGRVVRSNMSENGDAILDPIRALLRLHPTSPMQPVLPRRLLGLNRVHEALREKYAFWNTRLVADSANPQAQAEFWNGVAYDWHYLERYDSALVAVRRARALRPSAGLFLATELHQLAALGMLDSLRALVPAVEAAAREGFTFGFAGDTYLSTANELAAHGSADEARVMAERALAWFDRHEAEVAKNPSMGLRRALTLLVLGRPPEAEAELRRDLAGMPTDVRVRGALGRALMQQGKTREADSIAADLATMAGGLQGQPTYERATIAVQRGRGSWDDAIALLQQSVREGQDFTLLRRLHSFSDWQPLLEYAPFRRVITAVDDPAAVRARP